MSGIDWDRNSEEYKLIELVFEEKFPLDECVTTDEYTSREDQFQGFLASWEFIRENSITAIKEIVHEHNASMRAS